MAVGNNISNIYKMTVGGKTFQVDPASQGGYMKAYNQYAADAEASKNLYNQQFNTNTNRLKTTLDQNNKSTNANYDNNARQAYVDYMRKQRALPSQLQALGVRGGATESGLLNLYNNYGVEHAANEQQRAADLTSNRNAYDDAYAKLVADRTQYLMDYEKDLSEQKQKAIANQINEYNNEITRFSSSVAQYPTTSAGYQSYQAWINNMAKSNDPLIRQQMATQFPDGDPSAGEDDSSGGGGGGYSGGGGYRSYSNNNTTTASTGNSMTDYYRANAEKMRNYTPTRTTRGGGAAGSSSYTNTRSIKGDTYRVTSRGSYRSTKRKR